MRAAANTSSMEKNVIYARQRHVWMNVIYEKNVIYALGLHAALNEIAGPEARR
jgi:hypothetical protein